MKYFKVFETEFKPLVNFCEWADSIEKLRLMGEEDNPLIIAENLIPARQFGVYPIKIVAGELVARTSEEMEAFEAEYDIEMALVGIVNRFGEINTSTFEYDDKVFPMDEVSRLFYTTIEKLATDDYEIRTTSNERYILLHGNIPAFLQEYYKKMISITKHYL